MECLTRPLSAVSPSLEAFGALAGQYSLAMVTAETASDLETPVSAFMKLKESGPCFLLESAESDKMWGRYSFLGFEPITLARLEDGRLIVSSGEAERVVDGDSVLGLFELVEGPEVFIPIEGVPFLGGAVGYFGYGVLEHLEKVHLSKNEAVPEMMFMVPGRLAIFDHLRSRIILCAIARVPEQRDACRAEYEHAIDKIDGMVASLEAPLPHGRGIPLGLPQSVDGQKEADSSAASDDFNRFESNVTREKFEEMVDKARGYILAGDAFQVVVSQRFKTAYPGDPLSVYRVLRSENPSPYMFYLELPGLHLVGSSPEPLVTNRGGKAVIRPIAGTRPRGSDGPEDERLAKELLEDPKEKAEHIMLVDLARNDLGRVCRPGTVKVTRLMQVEKYSHVMHLVSEVEGHLKEGYGNYDLLKAAFPAGTVSGAPKVRACEIIEELEGEGRGPYAGAIGYLSYSGDMDTCITIRTVLIHEGSATVQAGAGIVADSIAGEEWLETRNKALALIRAVRIAGEADR